MADPLLSRVVATEQALRELAENPDPGKAADEQRLTEQLLQLRQELAQRPTPAPPPVVAPRPAAPLTPSTGPASVAVAMDRLEVLLGRESRQEAEAGGLAKFEEYERFYTAAGKTPPRDLQAQLAALRGQELPQINLPVANRSDPKREARETTEHQRRQQAATRTPPPPSQVAPERAGPGELSRDLLERMEHAATYTGVTMAPEHQEQLARLRGQPAQAPQTAPAAPAEVATPPPPLSPLSPLTTPAVQPAAAPAPVTAPAMLAAVRALQDLEQMARASQEGAAYDINRLRAGKPLEGPEGPVQLGTPDEVEAQARRNLGPMMRGLAEQMARLPAEQVPEGMADKAKAAAEQYVASMRSVAEEGQKAGRSFRPLVELGRAAGGAVRPLTAMGQGYSAGQTPGAIAGALGVGRLALAAQGQASGLLGQIAALAGTANPQAASTLTQSFDLFQSQTVGKPFGAIANTLAGAYQQVGDEGKGAVDTAMKGVNTYLSNWLSTSLLEKTFLAPVGAVHALGGTAYDLLTGDTEKKPTPGKQALPIIPGVGTGMGESMGFEQYAMASGMSTITKSELEMDKMLEQLKQMTGLLSELKDNTGSLKGMGPSFSL